MDDALDLAAVAGGTRLRLRVHPKARQDAVTGIHGGALKISVTAAPERGKANEAVVRVLAGALGVPRGAVAIVSGETSQDKAAVVALRPEELRNRLRDAQAIATSTDAGPPRGTGASRRRRGIVRPT